MTQQSKRLLIIRIILTTVLVLFSLINNTVALAEEPKESIESIRKEATEGDKWAQYKLGYLYFKGEGVSKNYDKAIEWCLKAQGGEIRFISFAWGLSDSPAKEDIEFLKLIAEHGVFDAQNTLGDIYSEGKIVPKDYGEAIKWYKKAANRGFKPSQIGLGKLYEYGKGVPQDISQAYEWYLKAYAYEKMKAEKMYELLFTNAKRGGIEAQYVLGLYLYHKTDRPHKKAFMWLLKAAEKGHTQAQVNLGYIYSIGNGAEKNIKEGFKWTKKAAEQGDSGSQYCLGNFYRNGEGVAQNYKEAAKWYLKSAEQGFAWGQFWIGFMYYHGEGVNQDYNEAAKWYKKAAIQGDTSAQIDLGFMYSRGEGVKQDHKESVKWYRKAAESGRGIAQHNLGLNYYSGEGVAQNYKEAAKWFRKAAEQGRAESQQRLGLIYHIGKGVPQDYKEAVKWYRKAAEQGNMNAQTNIGFMYENGKGVSQDYINAYAWYNLAVAQGNSTAEKNREIIVEKMTKSQIAKAQELSKAIAEGKKTAPEPSRKDDSGQVKAVGTGFFITRNGHILTCYHVVKGFDSIKINLEDKIYDAELVQADSHNDLALLKIQGSFPALGFSPSRTASLGDEVFTVGFPNPTLQGFSPKFTKGDINSLTGVQDDPRLYQISAPIHPGNSGGALINKNGAVVGCVVSTLNAKTAFKISGSIPQNVNYAIKSTYILAFLDSIPNVSSKLVQQDKNIKKSFTEIVEKVKANTVMVVSY